MLIHYLDQLENLVAKVSDDVFEQALTEDMFPFAMQVKIAANFALRGYCPLLGNPVVSFQAQENTRHAVSQQIVQTRDYLRGQPEVTALDPDVMLSDKAGFTEVSLPQPQFIHHYILPNFFFHISMAYAIAKVQGEPVSKADFDGYHAYPPGFSFIQPS
ncbi:DUF1993 domain-containing protein [Photobacterium sp. TY1-4]|uniref:DUF1993 domain-containing protein n=1 Tax=Photobacterium sp. TY1-4 TaxID=2899122 RepID=UPI0021C1B144|nr:DUF1993 domain-containing protein [Photobacterium sp. TY1-4]UXI03391.1 DUF1993 domain-containing protein [Photobacterium sp. TY1-4]